MATDYWVLVPTANEMNVAGTVANAFIVTTPQGSALDNELLGNYAGEVTVGGKSGYLRAGPYTSLAAAQAYLKVGAKTASTPIPGVGITPSGQVTVSNPLGILSDLTNPTLWLRVTKVVVGGIILIIGLAKLTGLEQSAGGAIKKGVKIAPFL
jgi:hypothetical protein